MRLVHFSVTQLRVAATCPRLHWFDARATASRSDGKTVVSRVWRNGEAPAGGGALFHTAIERFNAAARTSDEIKRALESAGSPEQLQQALMRWFNATCIDTDALAARPVTLVRGFIAAVQLYMEELARLAAQARASGQGADELQAQLFGDGRKRVDVTFHVGDDLQVHVAGAIDYVYFDPRLGKHRIVDYKLTPATSPNSDLFQVFTYALMHHHQHGTRPDVAVFYLHPSRSVHEASWEEVLAARPKIYQLIASMVAWADHARGRADGLHPPGDLSYCRSCKHERSGACVAELGDKDRGAWDRRPAALDPTRVTAEADAEVGASSGEEPIVEEDPEVEAARAIVPPLSIIASAKAAKSPATSAPIANVSGARAEGAKAPPAKVPTATSVPRASRPSSARATPKPAPTSREPGMWLGADDAGEPVIMDPSVLRTHVSVVGAAGSGKTWMAKVIAEEALRAGIPVVAIDPQGDLVQMMEARPREEIPEELRSAWDDFHARVEPRIWTPGSSHGTRLCLDPIRLPSASDLAHIESRALREEEEEGLLVAVAGNLVSLCGRGGEEESQRTLLYQVLRRMPRREAVKLQDIVAAISEPDVVGIDEPDRIIRKSEREKLARRLNTFVEGPAGRLFSGGTRLDFAELLRPSTPGKTKLNVVYLNALGSDDEKHFFLAALATELYRWMITRADASSGSVNLLFYIDEARDWIPAGASKPPAKQPLIRLFTQGRKYGVGCLLCTQSPRSVDYNVFGNTSTKLVGRLEASQDVDRVVDWFTVEGGAPPWVAARKGAPKGSFVARWPEMPERLAGRAFKGRSLFTRHAGAWSPDRVERAVTAAGIRGPTGTEGA